MGGFYDEIVAITGVYKYYVNGEGKETSSNKTVGVTNPSTLKKYFQVQGEQRQDYLCLSNTSHACV